MSAEGCCVSRARIVKLVRALRKGWIQTTAERAAVQREELPAYLLWQDDGLASDKTSNGAHVLCSNVIRACNTSHATVQPVYDFRCAARIMLQRLK